MDEEIIQHSGLVSVIIPVYNAQDYIGACLESAIQQAYKEIEVIVVDDGSSDHSGMICDEFVKRDRRVRAIHIDNAGPAAARNRAIDEARGEFIFFLDADDWLDPDAISTLMQVQKQSQSDMIVGNFAKVRADGSCIGLGDTFSEDRLLTRLDVVEYVRAYLKKPNRYPLFTYFWGRLFRKDIIQKNRLLLDETLHTFEDVAFNFDYLKFAKSLSYVQKPLYHHLVLENFTSASLKMREDPSSLFGYRKALAKAEEFLSQHGVADIDVAKEVGQAFTTYTIIQLIRACGQITMVNRKIIQGFIKQLVNEEDVLRYIQYYRAGKGESRVIPALVRLKWVPLLIQVCLYKAHKRYGKKSWQIMTHSIS